MKNIPVNMTKLAFILSFCLVTITATAQQRERFSDKLVYGGNFGATFGTVTYVNISPQVGYKVNDNFIPGISATYIYYRDPFNDPWNVYGGSVFARHFVSSELFLQAELENLNVEYYDNFFERKRRWISNQMIGAGYVQPLGGRSFINFSAMYILNYSQNQYINPYPSPWVIRAGITL